MKKHMEENIDREENRMNILLTGGLGFIGSHMARLLVEKGYDATIVDKETYAADIRRIEDIKKNISGIYIGDICNRELVEKIIREHDIDTLVNFAADTHVDNSIKNSEPFIHSNYIGVWNLLEIIRKNKEKEKDIRMIQISTDECYGSTLEGSFKETDRLNPGNPYSASKAGADLLCLSYVNTYGLNVSIARSSNNYGPGQDIEKYIPRMISLAIHGKDLEIYGNGKNVRDWLWVEDNCLGIKTVMENCIKGEIYNIGAGNEKSNNEIAKIISSKFGVRIKYISDRPGHDKRYGINCDKIKKDLGWIPKVKFEDGLEETIEWYIKEDKRKD